ncbi:hypothetical protein [Pedobacter heparinus]|uniref:Uncharacterized protein n=2 Tax=Pedobacter TaxID=84567 RepID=C6Y3Q7_PEDHD|nr:hypothetical protein [Pedobacter heparinus]ACU03336.1 hypothetical protein Phep_1118 [Pedobacter heparinus DSM 2366]
MKKLILKSYAYRKVDIQPRRSSSSVFSLVVMCLTVVVLSLSSCEQDKESHRDLIPSDVSGKVAEIASAQPLPGGKARFTWVNGNFDTNGYTWERIVNLEFNASAGTVNATLYNWQSDVKFGKTAFNSHRCTFDGVTKTCPTWSPTGWIVGGSVNPYRSWSGTYVYDVATGRLDISWTTGAIATESWTITNPTPTIARASLITSSYTLTHGRGYGSNASWSTYKNMGEIYTFAQALTIPTFKSTTSKRVAASGATGTATPVITAGTGFNGWAKTSLNLQSFTSPSSPTPTNSLHVWDMGSTACTPSACSSTPHPGATGIIYHLSSNNDSRQLAYTNNCACLSTASEFPCYPRNLHPSALMQIIDDNGDLVALVGIEAQNPVTGDSGNPAYQFHLWDFNNIP